MDEGFAGYVCWTAARVQESVHGDIATLGLNADAVFLAAHVPMGVTHLRGTSVMAESGEGMVLQALQESMGTPERNTVIAVTGESGSGKSHLVRWLRAHLRDDAENYHLVYVPRELATLRDLIGRILDHLPKSDEAERVRSELEKAVTRRSPAQMAETLIDHLRLTLKYDASDRDDEVRAFLLGTKPDEDGHGRVDGLADLMLERPIRHHLLRPDGAAAQIVGSLQGTRAGRDEEQPDFTVEDVTLADLNLTRDLPPNLHPLWRATQKYADTVVEILNDSLQRAVQDTLGMSPGTSMKEVFQQARRQLRRDGKDLVLLFEDLAQFGLFDGELFDQFVQQPGEEFAPIRAVFAITEAKFEDTVKDTVRGRLAHRFNVDPLRIGDPESMDQTVRLVAKYLNVARVGKQDLVAAWDKAKDEDRAEGRWIPNACRSKGKECPHLASCWEGFEEVDGVGLYPYDRTAIERAVRGHREGRVTPRVVVDTFVRDFLIDAEGELKAGTFPSDTTKSRFDFTTTRARDVIVPPSGLEEGERDRLHRTRVIWMDGTVQRPGITEAFRLPVGDGPPPLPQVDPPPGPSPGPGPGPGPQPPPPPPRPNPLLPLYQWESGALMPNQEGSFYRRVLFELVDDRLDRAALLLARDDRQVAAMVERILSPNSFTFGPDDPGRAPSAHQLRFELPPSGQSVFLLSAARWFHDHGHWDLTDEGRSWDLEIDALDAQVVLEEFVDDCARQVEGALVAGMCAGPLDPAAAVLALRTISMCVIGHRDARRVPTLDAVLSAEPGPDVGFSSVWLPAVEVARGVLQGLDAEWIAQFAAARQDAGEPQAVDAARLMPVIERAYADPMGILAMRPTFDASAAELTGHWTALQQGLRAAAPAEAVALREVLDGIERRLGEATIEETVIASADAGQRAADNGVFRPHGGFSGFKTACDGLKDRTQADLAPWLAARERLGGSELVAEVLAAQHWAKSAMRVGLFLEVIEDAMAKTGDEVAAQLRGEVGEAPVDIEARITDALGEVSENLRALEGSS
jgi:Cdc6-like AAA superfamily ATPase